MFFTLSAVEHVIVDLDAFLGDDGPDSLPSILSVLQAEAKTVIFVSSKKSGWEHLSLDSRKVLHPSSPRKIRSSNPVI